MKTVKSISVLIAALFILPGCSEPENSSKYYDSHVYNAFIQQLEISGVKYRKGENLSVFYPINQSQKAHAIHDEVIAKYYPGCGGSFTSKETQATVETELRKRGIPYTIIELDEGPKITCAPEYQEAFTKTFQSVILKQAQ